MEFDKQKFFRNLMDAPAEEPFLEPPEHSEYLQKQVFDKLAAEKTADLKSLDWDAFDLRHVTPENCGKQYETMHKGWLRDFNRYLRKIPAISLNQKRFF